MGRTIEQARVRRKKVPITNTTPKPQREAHLDAWLALTGQIPTPDATLELPLLSGSMTPAIPVGAMLCIAAGPAAGPNVACQVGDVAIFLDEDRLVAHRVLLVVPVGNARWLLEKGDANPLGHWRHEKALRGRVTGYTLADQTPVRTLTDPVLASCSLRQHLINWFVSLGGLRAIKPKS